MCVCVKLGSQYIAMRGGASSFGLSRDIHSQMATPRRIAMRRIVNPALHKLLKNAQIVYSEMNKAFEMASYNGLLGTKVWDFDPDV